MKHYFRAAAVTRKMTYTFVSENSVSLGLMLSDQRTERIERLTLALCLKQASSIFATSLMGF